MSLEQIAVLGVPSSAGARGRGQEEAPVALRAAGLVGRLEARGFRVTDAGDLPPVAFHPDPEHPRRQNLVHVVDVARRTADRVDASRAGDEPEPPFLLVLGGDCSLSLGVIAGLLRREPRLGLVYFDGDLDLNTPDTSPSGIFDGMVMAHILGRGAPELAEIGPRRPLLAEEDIVLFGYDPESGWIDPPELLALESSRMRRYSATRVRAHAAATAREALAHLEGRSETFLVHFDVDVMDMPAADVHHPHGLDLESAFAALEVFATRSKCAGLVVTEFNARRDPEGVEAQRLVDGLVSALGARREVSA